MLNFCYDKLIKNVGYPNLALFEAEPYTSQWREFDYHWPKTVPLRLLMYLDQAGIPYTVSTVSDAPKGSWYPIAFSWFDFSCDYFALLNNVTKARLNCGDIKILFYYHEGDNPQRIIDYLSQCCAKAGLPESCYFLISANTSADSIANATYFSEHEFFFRFVNRDQLFDASNVVRQYDFTILNRTHKWWRASVMSDLARHNLLDNSLWSYHTNCSIDESYNDNPIELDVDSTWRNDMHTFVNNGPYTCDNLDLQEQNDHHTINQNLYKESYFQVVVETHFDADQSGGAFITEKTWKAIKFGQPFIVVSAVGTLATLRNAGYKVFDSVLDNTYDTIVNNTDRWLAVRNLLIKMKNIGVKKLAEQCADDVKYNQQMFLARAVEPLNILLEKLQCQN